MPPKKCSFDCLYCQLGPTKIPVYEPTFIDGMTTPEKLRKDLEEYKAKEFDVITFSGSGEPTANRMLPKLVEVVREFYNKPVYLLTNASFLSIDWVARYMSEFDYVEAKLDAWNEESYLMINRPYRPRDFENFLSGHRTIRRHTSYGVQVMLTKITDRRKVLELAISLDPDKIHVTIPYRRFKRLLPDDETMNDVRDFCKEHGCEFFRPRTGSRYITEEDIQELVSRRPMSVKDIAKALGVEERIVWKIVESMERFGKIDVDEEGVVYYKNQSRRTSSTIVFFFSRLTER